jgi:hypothetical protein
MHSLFPMLAVAIPSFLMAPLLSMVLPAVAGTISAVAYQWIKKASDWTDTLPAQVHVIVIGAISIVLPQLAKLIPGFPTADSLAGLDPAAISTAVMFGLTQITHRFLQGPSAPSK